MGELDVLFPIPEGNRNADDMGMPSPIIPERPQSAQREPKLGTTNQETEIAKNG